MSLGSTILKHRKTLGITQESLAQQLEVTNQAVSKWEGDQCCPDVMLLPRLADLFGISVDALFEREAPEKPQTVEGLPWPDDGNLRGVLFHGWELVGHGNGPKLQLFCKQKIEADVYSDFAVVCGDVVGSVNAGSDVQCGIVTGEVDAGGDVQCEFITGDVEAGGDIRCGDVAGNVEAGGDVECKDVAGYVEAGGDVTCGDVSVYVEAGGDVSCGDVAAGYVSAGGDVNCRNVSNGSVEADGDVTCTNVEGNISAGGDVTIRK